MCVIFIDTQDNFHSSLIIKKYFLNITINFFFFYFRNILIHAQIDIKILLLKMSFSGFYFIYVHRKNTFSFLFFFSSSKYQFQTIYSLHIYLGHSNIFSATKNFPLYILFDFKYIK